ncbi:hypothetical protein POM88_001337 [Heracleum sosnowskyi]|uniref:DUF632 domain-containing protein n=1 Tax=Heracleum sosnowskyi TaxID=360622 RepID=A0AAD8NA92_9APIA|nr:hypothetical protein POM88_001337 [Heracleum sosnowskyi]
MYNAGHIDHATRVMCVITWNKSFRGIPNGEVIGWEKKLYEEVKAGELMKLEYQRKVGQLNKLKKWGASAESLEKTKVAVSHLHTRYIVDIQSLDSTVSEVNHIRDDQLYPKLVSLVVETAKMWDSMNLHHQNQLKIVEDTTKMIFYILEWSDNKQTGTQFWDENMQNELVQGRLSAEALVYGEADGGENDENLFRSISVLLDPSLSVARMSNQARWSVLQSYNLLKWHKHAHRAAVKALEGGGSLSVVIRKVEEAMSTGR